MKKIVTINLIVIMVLSFIYCVYGEEGRTTAEESSVYKESQEPITFTMYFVDPEASPYAEGGMKIAELVSDATEGRIEIEIKAGSEIGERDLLDMTMENQIDITTCANSILTNYIPQMNILDQPYLWKTAEEAHAAVDGALGKLIADKVEALGMHVIGFEESGFRNTFSVKPIEKIEDFQGVIIRTMENKYHRAAFEAFGATPVSLPYPEVMDALRSGKVNACENATANCLNSGYYEITKNVTNTQHVFTFILLLMSDAAYQRIPLEYLLPFQEAVYQGVQWERQRLMEANTEIEGKLSELGIAFHEIDIGELKKAYQDIAREKGYVFDPEWVNAVNQAIREAAFPG
ncbi:MAG: TRAP transporter substrate-binding protein [Blautia sp.]|nr:TRAP transporter substrate-binding protein [Blautia sp.]